MTAARVALAWARRATRSWLRSVYMEGHEFTGMVTPSVVLLILFNAAYGLCISAVLKHLGAMVGRAPLIP